MLAVGLVWFMALSGRRGEVQVIDAPAVRARAQAAEPVTERGQPAARTPQVVPSGRTAPSARGPTPTVTTTVTPVASPRARSQPLGALPLAADQVLAARFHAEHADEDASAEVSARIEHAAALSPWAAPLRQVECRQTLCRFQLSGDTDTRAMLLALGSVWGSELYADHQGAENSQHLQVFASWDEGVRENLQRSVPRSFP